MHSPCSLLFLELRLRTVGAEKALRRDLAFTYVLDAPRLCTGGNCYDFINKHGIRVSQYGVHLFHTQARSVADCCSLVGLKDPPEGHPRRCVTLTPLVAPATQSKRVWEYVNRWSEWMPYEHRCVRTTEMKQHDVCLLYLSACSHGAARTRDMRDHCRRGTMFVGRSI